MAVFNTAYFIFYILDRDDAAYILSTFTGIHNAEPLFSGGVSVADNVLNTYDYLKAGR